MQDVPHSRPDPRARWIGGALYFAAVALLLPATVQWDGLGFLAWSRDPLHLDFGHLLYIPLLRAARVLLAPLVDDAVLAAQLLSVCGAALSFVLLWARLERTVATPTAALGALFVTTTPLFLSQAGTIEPSTLTIAALLLAASAAERYGRAQTFGNAGLLGTALLLLFGLHLVSVFALPWLLWLALGAGTAGEARERPPLAHLLVPLGFLSGVAACVVFFGQARFFLRFPAYWRAFLPELSAASVGEHAQHAAALALSPTEGLPLLALVGLAALAFAGRGTRSALWLAVPYLGAFLLLGKPLVGLLLPVTLACGILFAHAAAALHAQRSDTTRMAALVAGVMLCLQLLGSAALGFERHGQPDERRIQAELFAAALPPGATMIVGSLGHHQTWFTTAPAVILPDEIHQQGVRGAADVLAFVRQLAEREAANHERVFITSEAIEYLEWRWNTDALALPLDPARRITVRAEPELFLLPFKLAVN